MIQVIKKSRILVIAFVIAVFCVPLVTFLPEKYAENLGVIPAGATSLQVSTRIAASADDVTYWASYTNSDTANNMGHNGANSVSHALRFTGITIPSGATITSAYITWTASQTRASQTVGYTIKGEDDAAPSAYGATEDFTARTYTTASVSKVAASTSWTIDNTYNSEDITSIINELYASYAPYASGVMAFEVLDNGSTNSKYLGAHSYDGSAAKAPLLVINYTYSATDAYWVGGSGNWSDAATHWAASTGGTPYYYNLPDATTNVHFDANSGFTAPAHTLTISSTANCNDMDWTGAPNNPAISMSDNLYIYGDATFISGMTTGATSMKYIYFNSAGAQSLTTDGITIAPGIRVENGGTLSLQDNLTVTGSNYAAYGIRIGAGGTLTTNNKNITVAAASFISLDNTSTLNAGSSTISTGYFSANAGCNINAGTSTIIVSANSYTISGGGKTYNILQLTGSSQTLDGNNTITTLTSSGASVTVSGTNTITTGTFTGGNPTLSASNSFTTLTITGTNILNDTVSLGGNQTVSGTLTLTGYAQNKRMLIKSNTLATARTLSAGTVSCSNVDFLDITGAGAGSWSLAAITGGSGDLGGNTGITFTTPDSHYWINNSGNWSDSSFWSASSGGSGGAGIPLVQDTAVFDANSFSVTARTVTVDVPYIGIVNSLGVINNPTISSSTTINMYGDFALGDHGWSATTGTYMYDRTQPFLNAGSTTLTGDLYIYANGTTCTLSNDLTITGTLYHRAGTFDLLTYNLTAGYFDSSTTTYTRVLSLGTGTHTFNGVAATTKWNFNATNNTLQANTSTIVLSNATASAQTFTGGTGITTYNILRIEGDGNYTLTFGSSNTYNKVIIDRSVASKTIAGNYTLTVTGGFFVPLAGVRTVTITNVDFSKASGIVSSNYLVISGSSAGGGATYNAGAASTDNGGNAGWVFGSLADPAVTTVSATLILSSGSTLNATVTSMGGYSTIDVGFEYGKTNAYGTYTAFQTGITGIGAVTGRRITALESNTVYHYRAIVRYNEADYVYGADATFTTLVSSSGSGTTGVPIITILPGAIPNMYTEGETGGLLGLDNLVNPALATAGIPEAAFWYPVAFLVAIALGFVAFGFTRQLIVQAVVSAVVMACFCGGGVLGDGLLPWWTVFIFIIEAIALVVIQEKQNA